MGIQEDTENSVAEKTVTQIMGHSLVADVTLLKKDLIQITANFFIQRKNMLNFWRVVLNSFK